MKLHASTGSKLCAPLFLMVLLFQPLFALAQKPEINVTIFRDLVRFAAPGEAQEARIEVFSATGEKIFDSDFVVSRTQDWPMQNLQGQSVESGLYTYTITVKDQAGTLKQVQRGNVIVDREREGLEGAPSSDHSEARSPVSTQPRPTGSWNVDHGKAAYSINAPAVGVGTQNPLARVQIGAGDAEPITKGSTLLLEEGEATGMVLKSTTGGEMFLSQDKKQGLFGTASNHPIGIRTNNFDRLWVTKDGRVGIGTTTPSAPLTVAGIIETTGGIKFPDGTIQTTAAGSNGETSAAGGTVNGSESGVEVMVKGGKKKGISPAGSFGAPWLLGGNTDIDSSNFLGTANGNTQPIIFKTSGTEAMRIAASSNVGIGATNPGQKLDVYGPAANIRVGSSTDAEHGLIVTPESVTERAFLYTTGGNANHSGHLRLSNGNSDITTADILMRNAAGATVNYITNSGKSYFNGGNVGIGTTNAQQLLDVSGASGARVRINSSGNSGVLLSLQDSPEWSLATVFVGGEFPTRDFVIYNERLGTNALLISGNSIITGGGVYPKVDGSPSLGSISKRWEKVYTVNGVSQTSDGRLKKDVTNLEYGLNKVMQLRPVTFKWKDGKEDSKVHIGLIAQETEKIIPEVVERGDDLGSTMSMNYVGLIPVLTKAIQEQQAGLDNKDARIVVLEAENSNQQKRITELEDKLVMLDERVLAFEQMLQNNTASARATKSKLLGAVRTNPAPVTPK